MRLIRSTRAAAVALAALATPAALSACGGQTRQDASEPTGKFRVQVTEASFPTKQSLSQHSFMTITVRNAGRKAIPNIAVTVCNVTCHYPAPPGQGSSTSAFASNLSQNDLANPSRPVWIVDRPPDVGGVCRYSCQSGGAGGAATAYSNTWALGRLAPGRTVTFRWLVTAVSAGHHVVAWQVAAGLNGKAQTIAAGGRTAGTFPVTISRAPAESYVNAGGQIVTTSSGG